MATTTDPLEALTCQLQALARQIANTNARGSCVPCQSQLADSQHITPSLTTTPGGPTLKNDAQRLGFTVSNPDAANSILMSTKPERLTGTTAQAVIGPGQTLQFTAYNFPADLTREWYARTSAGAISPLIVHERSLVKGR